MFLTGLAVFVVLGLAAGSFLNMCIHRLPRGLSIVYPPSACTQCDHMLGIPDLVPAFSYIFLGGKCRHCGQAISPRYLIVELLTALAFASVYFKFGISAEAAVNAVFSALIILITFSDLETQIIPDQAVYAGTALGLGYNLISGGIFSSIAGLVLCPAAMYAVYRIGTAVYKKEAMGGGDIKLAAFFGAFFGLQSGFLCLFLSFIVGAAMSVIFMAAAKKGIRDEIPFGPAMCIAAVLVLFYGNSILAWYIGL